MRGTTITFDCRECGEQIEAEVTITSRGYAAQTYGDPEGCYPGEGAEWHADAAVTCEKCGAVHDETWINENEQANAQVQETAEEPDDGPEYEPDDDYDDRD